MRFELPKLNFSYGDLEPYMDARTVEIHFSKHHQTYLDKFNAVLEKYPQLEFANADDYLKNLKDLEVSDDDRLQIKNQGGGFVNHNIYWSSVGPDKVADSDLVGEINAKYGTIESFKEKFTKAAVSHFGSGYAWLVKNANGELDIYSLPNQDSPYSLGHTPIFCLDIWEHAYYLKYQNRRQEFVENWWKILKFF